MWTKICANTNLEDALLAVDAGADAVGFVFAPSKRRVTPSQVAAITPALPSLVEKVGVFTSTDAVEIIEHAAQAGLTLVQLHSSFNPALVKSIQGGSGLRVLQVLDIPENASPADLRSALRNTLTHPGIHAVLLDASHGGASGGTGKPFDWERVSAVVCEIQEETSGRVVIAGGLRPGNVAAAIAHFCPWGVDVASGVESSPGTKDAEKVAAFIRAARQ